MHFFIGQEEPISNRLVFFSRIVETENGREYIPDTNSNNILALDGIWPPPEASEVKKGYMLRAVGPGGQKRYICVDCGKHIMLATTAAATT